MSKHRTHGTIRRRLLSGLLCLALVLGLLPSGSVLPARAASWADPYAQQLVEWGVMRGDISGNLNLDNNITRAEFVTMLNRAFGYKKLGGTPFTDVPSHAWYAQDIDIAYNAGYFKGMTNTLAGPNSPLTREQAAVLLARNLMLRETTGESLGFSDSRGLSEWSRGLIGAAVEEGMLNGYDDGTFRPFNNITRGEVSAMLVRAIGTPVGRSGSHSLGDVYGNVIVNSSNVTLRNTTIAGNLYLTGGIDLGNVLLENVTVLGRIVVGGAGESNASQSSVVLRNVEATEMVVDSMKNQFVTIRALGITDIPLTSVRSSAYLDDSSSPGYGLRRIELDGKSGDKLQLAGSIKEVVNLTPSSYLQLVQGSAEKVTIDEYAKSSQVLVDLGTRMDELNLDVATLVIGEGDIKNLNIGADRCEVEILPDNIVIRPGITATVNGEIMGSVAAAELSAEPRLMAGYPTVTNIAPTSAEGLYSASKPGTIYWAISALSDGSVSEKDLLSPPAYGGNIFAKQKGSITASNARAEYAREIKDLLPDGSYYISAILVDGRGNRSPVKVASFSTPDDTKPAFVGTPTMTRVTTTVAQATVTANKNCQLYWALLPSGATCPTAQQFKTGSVGSSYGYGTLSVVKNAPISITVNTMRLREKTEYWLYLWLTDANGAQSMAIPVQPIKFTTPDETPPIVTAPIQTGWYESSLDVTFSMNEAPSTLYWAIVAEGNQSFITPGADAEETIRILSDLRTKIKVESGTGAIAHGSKDAAKAYADILCTITGLDTAKTGTNNYTLYYVGKDAAGNYSERVGSVSVQTLDTTPPTVKYEFTRYNGDKTDEPMADSGIRLVFSEQVKGGSEPAKKTFLELYNEAVDTNVDEATRETARSNLAKELAAHIRLYSVPRTGQPVQIIPKGDDDTGNNWVLDFHNAVVSLENNGNLVVFLPGTADEGHDPAIQMDSGATYYVQLLTVYDNSEMHPNGVSNTGAENPSGNLTMGTFTTMYAQVILAEDDDYVAIPSLETVTAAQKELRLDMCFLVKPSSTSKVPDTERWDMILMSDTWVEADIYCQTIDKDGNLLDTDGDKVTKDAGGQVSAETWKKLGSLRLDTPEGGNEFSAKGLGYAVLGNDSTKGSYGVLKTDLQEGYTYHYGIHFTQFKGQNEGLNTTIEPPTWDGTVRMKFALIAGGRSSVANVSQRANSIYDPKSEGNMDGNDVRVISQWTTGTSTEKELLLRKPYTDTRVPEFYTGFPEFTTTSGSVTMDLRLDRGGTVYYLVAPANVVSPTVPYNNRDVDITAEIDGRTLDGMPTNTVPNQNAKKAKIKEIYDDNGLVYIPLDGKEREYFKEYIAFTEYAETSAGSRDGKDATVYTTPKFDSVRTPSNAGYDKITSIKSGSKVLGNAMESVTVTGLSSETDYYVYFVLQGGGDPSRVVQCYRFKTPEAKPPVINMTGSGNTALTIDARDPDDRSKPYGDSTIYYAIAVMSGSSGVGTLPGLFTTEYWWGDNGVPVTDGNKSDTTLGVKLTVLNAMSTPVPGDRSGRSYFDVYGGVDGINLKDRVRKYITDAQSIENNLGQAPIKQFTAEGPSKYQDFTEWMTSNSAEYVVLSAAKQTNASEDGSSYGFSAARGLVNRKADPPEFTTAGLTAPNGSQLFTANITGIYKTAATDENEMDDPMYGSTLKNWGSYYYSGTLTLRFSEPLYQVIEDGTFVRRAILAASKATSINSNQIRFVEMMTATNGTWDMVGSSSSAASTFTLRFDKIRNGCQVTFPSAGVLGTSNTNGQTSSKVLTLTFNATATTLSYDNTVLPNAATPEPGWRWSWQ